jgi:hypothetical protein
VQIVVVCDEEIDIRSHGAGEMNGISAFDIRG